MMQSRIRRLTIEGFRGVRDRLDLDLDADAVLITGGNGTGKTVIADAITWCLTGAIPTLGTRQVGESKKVDYVVSAFSPDAPAVVQLHLAFADRSVTVQRTGNAGESQVEIVGGAGVSLPALFGAADDDALKVALHTLAVLRQDVVSQFANSRSDERHASLRLLLGLGQLGEFEEATKRALALAKHERSAAQEQLAQLQTRRATAQRRLDDFRESISPEGRQRLLHEAQELLSRAQFLTVSLPSNFDAANVAAAGREIASVDEECDRLLPIASEAEAAFAHSHTQDAVEYAERQRTGAERALAQAAADAPWQRLAEAALPLLDDICPVCQQQIDRVSISSRLRQIVDHAAAVASELVRAQAKAEEARKAAKLARESYERGLQARRDLDQGLAVWRDAIKDLRYVSVKPTRVDRETITNLRVEANNMRNRLRDIYSTVAAPAAEQEIKVLETALADFSKELGAAEAKAHKADKKEQDAKDTHLTTKKASLTITELELKRLTPALQQVYVRLDPHPVFSQIDFVHRLSHSKGRTTAEVTDPRTGVKANPAIAFSEGQLNATAVALFSTLALTASRPAFPFIFLDDPLQALDGTNVLGLAELCRELRRQKQLIVTTHDRRFAALLGRKLAARDRDSRNLVLRLVGWRPEGPMVESEELPADDLTHSVLAQVA